jgi:hypothetical protein
MQRRPVKKNDDNRGDKTEQDSGRDTGNGKENMREPSASTH